MASPSASSVTAGRSRAWIAWGGLALLLPPLFYSGVRRIADSPRDSAVAAVMAGLLCAAAAALGSGYLVNAAEQLLR